MICVCQKSRQSIGNELKDCLAKSSSEDEESHDKLNENTDNDRLPVDVLSVPASDIKSRQEYEISENTDSPVTAFVVWRFSWDENTKEECNKDNASCSDGTMALGDDLFHHSYTMAPTELEWSEEILALKLVGSVQETYTKA